MAKRYDPIMCMMVDEPTKAQDAMPSDLKKAGYEVGTVEKYGSTYYTLVYNGKVISTSPTEANIVEKAKKHYANRHGKAQDAKVKDRLVKVPDNKLKEFEASLRSAGFKVVSKSDRGMTTHYQVEVNSSKKFSDKAELREWAEKIDAVCDKMDSVAPTTWNIGLTTDGKITAGLDVREMYVKDSASALDEAIKTCDAVEVETSKWSFSSGKSKPSGFGNWWFKIGTEEKNFSGNWSSAKAEAIKYAKEKGISRISLMT